MLLTLIIGIIVGASAILFAIQNPTAVDVTFLSWHFGSSLAAVIIIALAAGVVLGVLVCIPSILRRSLFIRTLRKDGTAREDEVRTLEERLASAKRENDALRNPRTVDLRQN